MLSEKKQLERIIIYVGAAIVSLLFFAIYQHIQKDTYYFIYPQYSAVVTYIFLVIGVASTIILLRKYLSYRKGKKFTVKFTIYSIALILSSSITIGCIKYLVYIADKTSYLVDENVLSKQLDNEEKQFKRLIGQLEVHKSICNSLVNELEHQKSIDGYRREVNFFWDFLEDNSSVYYKSKIKNVDLLLKKTEGIPFPMGPEVDREHEMIIVKKHQEDVSDYSIEINFNNSSFTIRNTKATNSYFITLFENPTEISSLLLKDILKSHVELLNTHIYQLTENISLIEKRGLPLTYFTMDSMMKSFNSSPGYYKPINLGSMLLSLLHILIIVYFIIPLIGIGTASLKSKFNKVEI